MASWFSAPDDAGISLIAALRGRTPPVFSQMAVEPVSSVRKTPLLPEPPSQAMSGNLPSMVLPTHSTRIETAFMRNQCSRGQDQRRQMTLGLQRTAPKAVRANARSERLPDAGLRSGPLTRVSSRRRLENGREPPGDSSVQLPPR